MLCPFPILILVNSSLSHILRLSSHSGFLPVIYTLIRAYWRPPIQLPIDSQDQPNGQHEDDALAKSSHPGVPLTGYKVLLFWLPAALDLTGTTVRRVSSHPSFSIL